MTHIEVYKLFKSKFPDYSGDMADRWYPAGRNTIRVVLKDRQELIFSFQSDKQWRFETIDSFIENMKGERK